jgi:hypothetical protein
MILLHKDEIYLLFITFITNFTKFEMTNFSQIRQTLAAVLLLLLSQNSWAQVTTNGGSGLAPTFTTLSAAINALNGAAITSPVVITLDGGYNETAPSGGYIITAQGSAANTIQINGNGNTITASAAHTVGSRTDAIFKLVGADYVTLQNFTMQENAANIAFILASNTKTEFGVGLFYNGTSNGATNNTIQNNTISLDRSYQNSFGIYSNTRHSSINGTATADATATGRNINNKIYANDISNVNAGICFVSPAAATQRNTGNDIGGNSPTTGNRITNWGSAVASNGGYISVTGITWAILLNHEDSYNVSYNLIESAAGISVANMTGIYVNNASGGTTNTAINTISNNTISLTNTNTGGTQFSAIRLGNTAALPATTFNVEANVIQNCLISGVNTTMPVRLIYSEVGAAVVNITNNIFLNNRFSHGNTAANVINAIESTGALGEQINISGNVFGNATTPPIVLTAAMSGTTRLINNSTIVMAGRIDILNNIFYGIGNNVGTANGVHIYIANDGTSPIQAINNNEFRDIVATHTGSVNLILSTAILAAAAQQEVKDNSIVGTFTKTSATGSLTIYSSNTTSNTASIMSHTGNNFSNITCATGGGINGWSVSDGNATNIKNINNNTFENWTANTITVISLSKCGAGSTVNNNTIRNITGNGVVSGIVHSGAAGNQEYNGNTISNLSGSVATGMNIATTSAVVINIANNIINEIRATATLAQGMLTNGVASGQINIHNNTLTNISTSANNSVIRALAIGGAGPTNVTDNSLSLIGSTAPSIATISGIHVLGGSMVRITGNKVFDISSTTAFTNLNHTAAISLSATAADYFVANNRISKIYAPNDAQNAGVIGIWYPAVGASKRVDILYNTIYLDGTSSGAGFGSACLSVAANPTAANGQLFLNNNILVNTGLRKGGGGVRAIFRNSTNLSNYSSTSNNNLYYVNLANIASAVCYAIPTSYTTLADWQAAIAPAETNSVFAMPLFLSLDGNDPNYLHLAPEGNCQIDGKGAFIATVSDDTDGEARHATTPDIGADEFVGLPYVASVTNPSVLCIGQTADITAPAITAGTTAGSTFTYWTDATATTTFTTPSTAAVGTYYIKYKLGNCEEILSVVVASSGNIASTAPVINPLLPEYCPNTVITLSAAGGTTGTGSDIYWYSAANGGGTALGTGSSITVSPASTTAYFARREGVCNTTADDSKTVNMRAFVYALNNTTASDFCTDGSGWHHFYSGGQIILSLQGDLSTAGTVTATIGDNGTYYSSTGSPANCATLADPGLARFEMARNWNISYTGTLNGTYNVRFYYTPAERVDVETAAANWIAANLPCSYAYKYNAGANGWFWFKNTLGAYTAPQYDGLQLTPSGTGTANGINYVELTNVSSFSGGSGAIILESPLTLPIEWLSFDGHHAENRNFLYWATASESNNAYFDLERSADGASNFQLVAKINSQGDSQSAQYYNLVDNTPLLGTNYYRLRQVDTDGSQSYSKIIAISANTTVSETKFSPNPASNQVEYQYIGSKNEAITATVYNALGQVVKTQHFEAQIGYNRLQISLENLAAGAYQVHIQHQSSTKTAIIIKE